MCEVRVSPGGGYEVHYILECDALQFLGKPTYHSVGRIRFLSVQCRRWGQHAPPKHCLLRRYTDLYFGKV